MGGKTLLLSGTSRSQRGLRPPRRRIGRRLLHPLRPILNMRPGFRHWLFPSLWQFNADLHLVDRMENLDYESMS